MSALVLTLGVAAVTLFLLLLSLRTPHHWGVKAAVIVVCSVLYAAFWHALPRLEGWPLAAPPPREFELIKQFIVQPDKRGGDGAVYLWVLDLTADGARVPRAYQLPYSAELHEEIIAATADGKPQKGVRVKVSAADAGATPSERIEFQPMPTTRLPPKD